METDLDGISITILANGEKRSRNENTEGYEGAILNQAGVLRTASWQVRPCVLSLLCEVWVHAGKPLCFRTLISQSGRQFFITYFNLINMHQRMNSTECTLDIQALESHRV